MERKVTQHIEWKFDPSPETKSFIGYASVFNNVDAYGDVIRPGAFAQYLSDVQAGKQRPPAMLLQHGGMGLTAVDEMPIGRWDHLSEDGYGLQIKGHISDTTVGRDVYTLLKDDAMSGLSIGYIAKEFTPRTKPEEPKRTLTRIDLVEVSVVTRPANDLARVASVKAIEDLSTIREIEEFLCDVGWTRSQAQKLIAGIKGAGLRDSAGADGSPRDSAAELTALSERIATLWRMK